jgi:hypothetical protein
MIGSRLSHYEITHHLGSGGMGEVYQATDSKLGRNVAIKLLPAGLAKDEERIARFQREARVLASLNHPHIAGIHGIEESAGRVFLVLELVTGETLEDRIRRGAIPIDEAMGIATQIADALEAAHDAGVIHRDLKPANVKLTSDGHVKVLDFGLAKALAADTPQMDATQSPTMSLGATQHGVILGTAAYMSPEQARGKVVDRRADIWAFGVVLYEMVTGKRLFQGEDLTDTLAAVVREKPDWSAAPALVQPILAKCLERDPKKRMRHISALPLLLEKSIVPAKSRFAWMPWLVAVAAGSALAILAYVHFRETPPELNAVQFSMEAPTGTTFVNQYGGYAPSPDGRWIAMTARTTGAPQIWLRSLDSVEARPLPGTEEGNFPAWSPDSKSLVFVAGAKLKRIEIAGGAPLTLADAPVAAVPPTPAWSTEGVILFGGAKGIQRVSASSVGASPLTQVDESKKETGHGFPQFLDANRFLYFVASIDPAVQGIYASSLDEPDKRQPLLRTAAKAVFVAARGPYPGYLLWLQEQTLLAQQFNPKTLKLEGTPLSVAEDIGLNPNFSQSIRAAFYASHAGLLVYFAAPTLNKVPAVWIDRSGKRLGDAAPAEAFSRVAIAPGGDRIAVAKRDVLSSQANLDIWIRELARGVMTRLTFDARSDDIPVWSPDGKYIAFSSDREGVMQLYRKETSGAGSEERLTEGPNVKLVLDWSRDNKYLLYREVKPETSRDLMAIAVEGDRKPFPVVATAFMESTGAISPDGHWVAYASNESGSY